MGGNRERLAAGLRAWAQGSAPVAAGVELMIRACGGRFLTGPWVVTGPDGAVRVDVDALGDRDGLSGGQRRVLAVVAGLVTGSGVDVVDVVTGLDREHLHLVLAALAHAGGSGQDTGVVVGPDGLPRLVRLGPVVAWPAGSSSLPGPHTSW